MLGLVGFAGTINNNLRFTYIGQGEDVVRFDNSNEVTSVTFGMIIFGQFGCPITHPYFEEDGEDACVDQCPSTSTQTPSSGTCEDCSSPCNSCGDNSDECLTCLTGYSLSDSTCVASS